MKHLKAFIAAFVLFIAALGVKAQSSSNDYFAGKWAVMLKGLPQGDTKMTLVIEKKSDSLTGTVQDSTGNEISKIDKIELKDTTATFYFSAQGYDVNLVLNRKDEDHVTGSLMNMFDAEGERIREIKK